MIEEHDLRIRMRDGVRLAVDVYQPDGTGPFAVLYAAALHNKDLQEPDMADILPAQPANVPLWFGPIEAGDTRRLIAYGYVHVIAQPRGSGKSEGHYGSENTDHYDVIDWISCQPWCDGNVGMIGISGYAGEQWRAAAQGHPALKAIFPYDACSAYGGMFGFRDFYPGGVLHTFPYLLDVFSTMHERRDVPGKLPPKKAPRKLRFTGPAHLERPFHQYHDEIIRWYDHWLKGIDNGIVDEPPVRYWLMGANDWRTGGDWPLPETQWRRLYLSDWERLTPNPQRPAGETGRAARGPDVFTQMPLKKTMKVERLRYVTEPLAEDLTVVGPTLATARVESTYGIVDDGSNDLGDAIGPGARSGGRMQASPARTSLSESHRFLSLA